MTVYNTFSDEDFFSLVRAELQKARKKFPLCEASVVALGEEAGELAQAALSKSWKIEVREEAVQVAAMAIRVAVEGDLSLLLYRRVTRGPQHLEDMPKRCPYKGCSDPYRATPPCALCYE